jgi:hypothetical protein
LVHEAAHVALYRSARLRTLPDTGVESRLYHGKDAEEHCFKIQIEASIALGATGEELELLRSLEITHEGGGWSSSDAY